MEIGEKIKMLRTAKLMTQKELAGSEITRNMLSRIENGAAQPSLDTLRYIAKKLNVSAGFLLAEEGDEQVYIKHNEIHGIKTAYLTGDYRICRDMCINSASADDDEIMLILSECTLNIAIEEFSRGSLRDACEYFDLAIDACSDTIYNTSHITAAAAAYFKYMRQISATLSSNIIDESEFPAFTVFGDAFCLYANAFVSLREGDTNTSCKPLDTDTAYGLHIKALLHIGNGEYSEAYDCLYNILVGADSIPEPMMYFVFCDLELCCKEKEDFKGAYEYSMDKIDLLQKMLS